MIIKLTLETEDCESVMRTFLKRYNYLCDFPATAKEMENDKKLCNEFMNHHKNYIRIIQLPNTALKDDEPITVDPTETEKLWIKHVIREAFNRFTDSEYHQKSLEIEIVSNCDAAYSNGKAFYVFPTSYSKTPVLNF